MTKYLYEALVRFQPDGRAGAHREYRDTADPSFVEVVAMHTGDFPARDKAKLTAIFGSDNMDLLNALSAQNAKIEDLTTAVAIDEDKLAEETAALANPVREERSNVPVPDPTLATQPTMAAESLLSKLTFGLLK